MPTFGSITPLTQQVTHALKVLRDARKDGDAQRIYVAACRLDRLLDRLPRTAECPQPTGAETP